MLGRMRWAVVGGNSRGYATECTHRDSSCSERDVSSSLRQKEAARRKASQSLRDTWTSELLQRRLPRPGSSLGHLHIAHSSDSAQQPQRTQQCMRQTKTGDDDFIDPLPRLAKVQPVQERNRKRQYYHIFPGDGSDGASDHVDVQHFRRKRPFGRDFSEPLLEGRSMRSHKSKDHHIHTTLSNPALFDRGKGLDGSRFHSMAKGGLRTMLSRNYHNFGYA
ncbi:hypothetical protein EJ03DRAFT_339819 [Teratosphaeria nubilosa]|uniref:Uncharacterized protein n=1 Tax=Teratosphaeria nubilosa TaxID=161662 RepID=A0A6G1KUU1_9PEZI|nr:hypothetical protein EJ03DRAFT_339819 [Teratosphaeria nubilosa]